MKIDKVSPSITFFLAKMTPYLILSVLPLYFRLFFLQYSAIFTIISLVGFLIIFIKVWYISTIQYSFYDGQIIFERGILSKKTDYLEMYRVKDYNKYQSFLMRIFGVMKITLATSDTTHRIFIMNGIKKSSLAEDLRMEVERYRRERRVYEVD